MMKEIFSEEDLQKVKDFFETGLGLYIKNWFIGMFWVLVILIGLYIISCFISWSILLPPRSNHSNHSEDWATFGRVLLILYSLVVLMVTFGSDDDYGY